MRPPAFIRADGRPAPPGSPRGSLLIFWDYDTQWGADRSRAGAGPAGWGPMEFVNTERLLDLHSEHGIPACFAVVGAAALDGARPYHDPAQIRRIDDAGHEVASHSLRHDWLPGLGPAALRETLVASKRALEDCIGRPVTSFVPPYNQPFDYPRGLSISLSERRTARGGRTGLSFLCRELGDIGYRFCRVSYRPWPQRLAERIAGRPLDRPGRLLTIEKVRCLRLNASCGFLGLARQMLERCALLGGFVVVYGHPHSLHSGGSQDESALVPFLRRARELVEGGQLAVRLPRELA